MDSMVKLTVQLDGKTYELWKAGPDGVPRAKDLDVARWLGFERPRNIRKLIERQASSLGEVCSMVEQTSEVGGRPGKTYYLTEEQALFIASKSDTPTATSVLKTMISVFVAAWRGGAESSLLQRVAELARRLETAERRLAGAAHITTAEAESIRLRLRNVAAKLRLCQASDRGVRLRLDRRARRAGGLAEDLPWQYLPASHYTRVSQELYRMEREAERAAQAADRTRQQRILP